MKKNMGLMTVLLLAVAMTFAAPAPAHASWLSKAFKKVTHAVTTIANPFSSPKDRLNAHKDLVEVKTDQAKNKFKAFKQAHEDGTKLIVKTHENGTRSIIKTHEGGTEFALRTGEGGTRAGLEFARRTGEGGTRFAVETAENGTRAGLVAGAIASPTNHAIAGTVIGTGVAVQSTRDTVDAIDRNEEHLRDAHEFGMAVGAGASPTNQALLGTAVGGAIGAQATSDTADVVDQNQETLARLALVGSPEGAGTLLATNAAYRTIDDAADEAIFQPAVLRAAVGQEEQVQTVSMGGINVRRRYNTSLAAQQEACRQEFGTTNCWTP